MKIKNLLLSALLCTSMLSFSQADLPNNGITSPTHQKYMGKIVFALSSAPLGKGKGNENESEFITKATLGEGVYYRAYLDNSLTNYLKATKNPGSDGTWKIKFYIDGTESGSWILNERTFGEETKQKWTTFKGALKSIPFDELTGEIEFDRFLKKNGSKFTVGDHVLKIEYMPYSTNPQIYEGQVVASGEITLTVKNALTVKPNDEETCLPKAFMNDKILEEKIKKAYDKQGFKEKVVKIKIRSDNWIVEKNSRGIILNRHVDAVVAYTKDGECAYEVLSFYQRHTGAGYENDVYMEGISKRTYVNCGCLK